MFAHYCWPSRWRPATSTPPPPEIPTRRPRSNVPALGPRRTCVSGAALGPGHRALPATGRRQSDGGAVLVAIGNVPAGIAAIGTRPSPPSKKSQELGAFQWKPSRMVYRGEIGLGPGRRACRGRPHATRPSAGRARRWRRDCATFADSRQAFCQRSRTMRNFASWSGPTMSKRLSRDEGFRHDLRFLLHEAKRIHFDPFRPRPRPKLDAMAASNRRRHSQALG